MFIILHNMNDLSILNAPTIHLLKNSYLDAPDPLSPQSLPKLHPPKRLICSSHPLTTGPEPSTDYPFDNPSDMTQRSWTSCCPALGFRVALQKFRDYDYDYPSAPIKKNFEENLHYFYGSSSSSFSSSSFCSPVPLWLFIVLYIGPYFLLEDLDRSWQL